MPKPIRIQLRRTKGFRLTSPNGLPVVVVSRPSKWGNPFKAHGNFTKENAVRFFRFWLEGKVYDHTYPPTMEEIRRELAGKNLACWCRVGDVCHADVLMEICREGGKHAQQD